MAFIEARLLDKVAYGFQIGPRFNTRILTLRNGHERRNANWSLFQWKGSAPYQNIKPDHYGELLGAFLVAGGMANGFRFKNWVDYIAEGESLGLAPSGTAPVQLVKAYPQFGLGQYQRTITKPVSGSVTVYQAGVAKAGTVDTTTGLFTPSTSWTGGAALTADFEFDIPMRFDADWLPMTYGEWQALSGEVPLIEVFGE